jgi:hypothetical protein
VQKNRADYCVNDSRGSLNINGGTFTGSKSSDYAVSEGNTTETSLTINGGEFNGKMSLDVTKADTELNGGTYMTYDGTTANTAVTAYLPADQIIDTTTGQIKDVDASTVAKTNSAEFASLKDALDSVAAGATATITLLADCTLPATYEIIDNQKITIDLNGNDITTTARAFNIRHGQLTIKGNGNLNANFTGANAAVAVYGAATDSGSNYSTFTLTSPATINAPNGYGAMIGATSGAAYGAKLQLGGTINSKYGVYINGNVAEPAVKTNAAAINITGTVIASNDNAAVYLAGYAKNNIYSNANLTAGSGVYIKSGTLNIYGNAVINATGAKTDYLFNSNGCDATGDAVIIDSCGYPGNIPTVTVKAGTITSANGEAVASYAKQDDPLYPTAEYPRVGDVIPATSTAVFSSDVSDLAVEGYETTYDSEKGGYVVAEDDHTVAIANGERFDSFVDALASISTVTTASNGVKYYKANGTVKLLDDVDNGGIAIDSGSDLVWDFNGHTYNVTNNAVGSTGTETIALQLLKDSTIVLKNGTLTSEWNQIQRIIQNYSDLTLDNMTISLKGYYYNQITMANCNGDVVIKDSTVEAPDFTWLGWTDEEAADSLGAAAFSVGTFSTYPSVDVTVTGNSTIDGNVIVDDDDKAGTAALTLESGTVNGDIVMSDNAVSDAVVTNEGATVDGVSEGFEWNTTTGVLQPVADAFNLTVDDSIHVNLYVNADAYDADEITVTYSDPAKQNGGTTTDTFDVADLTQDAQGRYAITLLSAPAQIMDTVTVTVGSHTFTTSVKAYCDAIIADNSDADLVALATAMLDYGKAASDAFDYNEAAFTYDYSNLDLAANAAVLDASAANGKFTGFAYIATSVPTLRVYLNTTEANVVLNDRMAYVDGVAVAPTVVEGTDKVCVDITGIKAEDLDKVFTIEFNGGTLTLNALAYTMNPANSAEFNKALFNYNKAAEAVFA